MEKNESSSISKELSYRYAIADDNHQLLIWRNNPNVRRFSRNSELIEGDTHNKWLAARLLEIRNQPLLVFLFEQTPIGMVRLDAKTDLEKIFEISVLVDESFQKRGFATSMITQALEIAKNDLLSTEIRAIIHKENTQSIRLFNNLKFVKIQDSDGIFREYKFHL